MECVDKFQCFNIEIENVLLTEENKLLKEENEKLKKIIEENKKVLQQTQDSYKDVCDKLAFLRLQRERDIKLLSIPPPSVIVEMNKIVRNSKKLGKTWVECVISDSNFDANKKYWEIPLEVKILYKIPLKSCLYDQWVLLITNILNSHSHLGGLFGNSQDFVEYTRSLFPTIKKINSQEYIEEFKKATINYIFNKN